MSRGPIARTNSKRRALLTAVVLGATMTPIATRCRVLAATPHKGPDTMQTMRIGGPVEDIVFEPEKLIPPHKRGWCEEVWIEHHWKHPHANSFHGPQPNEFRRYCINCGLQQERTPPVTTPASDWFDKP